MVPTATADVSDARCSDLAIPLYLLYVALGIGIATRVSVRYAFLHYAGISVIL